MVLLGYAQSVASSAGSFAFATASSYVFRPDASTSAVRADSQLDSSTSTSSSKASSRRLSIRRSPSQSRLPSAHTGSGPISGGHSPSSGASSIAEQDERGEAEDLVDELNMQEDLYVILGVDRRAKTEEIRRAFLARSRVIHPDKLPLYPPATTAFQRLSYAYETLSKPSSRRLYDLGGGRGYDPGAPSANTADGLADETLHGVLRNVVNEFLSGDFEMIRVFVTALNEGNPGLNLGDETVDNVEGAFRPGQRYLRLVKFELIRLYEIQSALRSLGYFDVYGRLRLTLALTRVTLEIPMVLDRAMRDEVPAPAPQRGLGAPPPPSERDKRQSGTQRSSRNSGPQEGQLERRGLLGTKTRGMLVLTCKMLERAERWTGSPDTVPSASSSGSSGR
ncbi:hypothetical protein Rhopal_003162-T1 [Rhodotorula paludigena]|uniref:J domain-containing protein n=1 Tax=Rhodotorula paludigena TaxID=86838 RepID=A0AAV5GIZ0_9BASI|nr:hypothetical protein Rhopal_003162-T1 [Rhodotorula paludigena]